MPKPFAIMPFMISVFRLLEKKRVQFGLSCLKSVGSQTQRLQQLVVNHRDLALIQVNPARIGNPRSLTIDAASVGA